MKCKHWILSAIVAFAGLQPQAITGAATLTTIGTGPVVTPRFDVGANFTALTYAAANEGGYGVNVFYTLNRDNAGITWSLTVTDGSGHTATGQQ